MHASVMKSYLPSLVVTYPAPGWQSSTFLSALLLYFPTNRIIILFHVRGFFMEHREPKIMKQYKLHCLINRSYHHTYLKNPHICWDELTGSNFKFKVIMLLLQIMNIFCYLVHTREKLMKLTPVCKEREQIRTVVCIIKHAQTHNFSIQYSYTLLLSESNI